jgi:glycosyltransferase involved in cell wall biosynthesis
MIIMKILIVTPYFCPEGGGLENYIYNVSKGLLKKGYKITILCSTKKGEDKEETIDGIRVIRQKPDFIFSNTPIKLSLLSDITKLIKENDFDLINAHMPVPYYADVAAIASKLSRKPFIATTHADNVKGTFLMNAITNIYNYIFYLTTLSLSKEIITPSPYYYEHSKFLKYFKRKLELVPPGVDIKKYSPRKSSEIYEKYNIPKNAKVILFAGQMGKFHVHKGVDYLIKAFKLVLDKTPAYLVLVGGGDMIGEYKQACKKLGIQDRVFFSGFISERELIEHYRFSSVVVLPSTIQEGFGMVLIEGNACGKPVVGTDVGGISYVVKDGQTGLLVPPKDHKALAHAMLRIITDKSLANRMGKNGQMMVKDNFTWDKAVDRTFMVYKRNR